MVKSLKPSVMILLMVSLALFTCPNIVTAKDVVESSYHGQLGRSPALGGWGMARVDFLQHHDGRLFINEINTVPGFTSISMYPRLWEISGMPIARLVDRLVEIAIARHRDRNRMDREISDWLAELAG